MSPKEEGTTVTKEMMTLAQAKIKVQEMILVKLRSMPHAFDADVHDAVFADIKTMAEQVAGDRDMFCVALAHLTYDPYYLNSV